ncbi:MAG: hypothetical protein M3P50_00050 [Actinomycetota bacterium]|nr:hypothetical protein [Actinomycetota bacterium]
MGVEAVWWIGLAGGAVAGLVLLKLMLTLHRIVVHILVVARMTRDAARSIAANMRAVSELGAVDGSAPELRDRIRDLAAALAALEASVERLPGLRRGSAR